MHRTDTIILVRENVPILAKKTRPLPTPAAGIFIFHSHDFCTYSSSEKQDTICEKTRRSGSKSWGFFVRTKTSTATACSRVQKVCVHPWQMIYRMYVCMYVCTCMEASLDQGDDVTMSRQAGVVGDEFVLGYTLNGVPDRAASGTRMLSTPGLAPLPLLERTLWRFWA